MSDQIETMTQAELINGISRHLSSKGINAKPGWTNEFVRLSRPGIPIASLQQTAYFQLLSSDLTRTIQPTSTFNSQLANIDIVKQTASGAVPVQVLDIEDIGTSAWSQVEAIEANERGETTRGREIIRTLPPEQTTDAPEPVRNNNAGPFKLLVQDARGTQIYALVFDPINKINLDMPIGSKLMLKDASVARGVLMLNAQTVQVLGGKIEAWDTQWRSTRKQRLTEKINS